MPESDDPHARRTFDLDAELSGVEGLADLPDDVREAFAGRSVLRDLERNQIVGEFALALVLDGEVDVSSTDPESPRAARVRRGEPLRARGTTDEAVPLHLICATDSARVATWDAAAVEAAFKACPWVEEDLRAAADRVQTLVAVSLGPLGRLDSRMREDVVARLEARALLAGDVIVEQGKPVPGLVIVGIGDVELVRDGEVEEHLGAGAFLFTEQILHAGSAPATARAGKGGVLILSGNRMVAQELLVTCAPLLEIFAGM
jgi:CRP-like cAMP-binding protein